MASAFRVRLISSSASSKAQGTNGTRGFLSLAPLGHDDGFRSALTAARTGDERALGELYRVVQPRVLRYLRVMHPSAAEQLASQTWLEIAGALRDFDDDQQALLAWALAVAHRRARQGARRASRGGRDAGSGAATSDALAEVAALPRARAEVLLLRVLGGMSVDEVARVTGRRPRTVRILQHLALRSLARRGRSR